MIDAARILGRIRIAVGILFLVRTTPLLYAFPYLLANRGGPLFGWPEEGWRVALGGVVLPSAVIAALCIVRTIAGVAFTVGIGARVAGVVASASAYIVYAQEPLTFIFTLHGLYASVFLLAIGDGAYAVAIRPRPAASPASSLALVRAFVISIYAWAAIAKLRASWLDGYTLAAFHEDGYATGWLADVLLATPARCRASAWATLGVEASLPILLVLPRTRGLGILAACILHAIFEMTVHPDVFGWLMLALLYSFWPGIRADDRAKVI